MNDSVFTRRGNSEIASDGDSTASASQPRASRLRIVSPRPAVVVCEPASAGAVPSLVAPSLVSPSLVAPYQKAIASVAPASAAASSLSPHTEDAPNQGSRRRIGGWCHGAATGLLARIAMARVTTGLVVAT